LAVPSFTFSLAELAMSCAFTLPVCILKASGFPLLAGAFSWMERSTFQCASAVSVPYMAV
jgi:hypothetical protein